MLEGEEAVVKHRSRVTKTTQPEAQRRRADREGQSAGRDDLGELTKAQLRKIERTARDLDDPTRYFLVSDFGPRFKLYYDLSNDVYGMNSPDRATLFKRRAAALAVRGTLGKRIKLVRCKTHVRNGKRVPVLTGRKVNGRGRGESQSRRTRG